MEFNQLKAEPLKKLTSNSPQKYRQYALIRNRAITLSKENSHSTHRTASEATKHHKLICKYQQKQTSTKLAKTKLFQQNIKNTNH